MTWKSYAAVSSATVLAGWLASAPPANAPAGAAAAASARQPRVPAPASSSDIEQQAIRLQARGRADRAFTQPQRNPFRFEVRAEATRAGTRAVEVPVLAPPPQPVEPAPPPIRV